MKRCSCCRKLLPDDAFCKNTHIKDGLDYYCKACRIKLRHGERPADIRPIKRSSIGGWKITVLNYAKANESKFNIYDTDRQKLFQTNDKKAFADQIFKLLEAI